MSLRSGSRRDQQSTLESSREKSVMPLHTCNVPTFTKTTYTESQSNRTQITGNNGTGRNSLPESAEKSSRAFHRRRDRSGESRGGRMWRTRANRELYDHVRHERLLQNAGRPKI
jgi:predicted ATPase